MDQWLVRTSKNWIVGPYSKDQLCKMILEGKLTHEDEICPANGYWVFLREQGEVQSLLGIQVPKPAKPHGEDVTETQTLGDEVDEDSTDPHLSYPDATTMTENTAVLTRPRAKTKADPASAKISSSASPRLSQPLGNNDLLGRVQVRGQGDDLSSRKRWVLTLLLIAAVLGFLVFKYSN